MPKNKTQYEILRDVKYFNDVTTLQIIMAIHRQSGACFAKVFYNEGEGIQENFVSGFLTAFSSFEAVIGEQIALSSSKSNEIKTKAIQYGDFTITIIDGDLLRISLISSDLIGNLMREKCVKLMKLYEKIHTVNLQHFSGNMDLYLDFHRVVEKEIDVKLNYKSTINQASLNKYDGPKSVKKVLGNIAKMGDVFYPKKIPGILIREASLSETNAKFYTYEAFLWYIFEPEMKK